MFMATVPEREVVLIPPFFEVHCTSDIFLLLPSSSDSCVVYDILLVAVVFNGAFVLVSSLAVAAFLLFICMPVSPDDLVVMPLDNLLHVLGTGMKQAGE